MLKFVGKALAGLVLTKEAQEAVGQLKVTPFTPTFPFPSVEPESKLKLATSNGVSVGASAATPPAETPKSNRDELIRNAMSIRASKQGVLADLDSDSRAKLVALAMKALLNEGPLKG